MRHKVCAEMESYILYASVREKLLVTQDNVESSGEAVLPPGLSQCTRMLLVPATN